MTNKRLKSFYDWCKDNNKQDLLDRWDYELNKCKPEEISAKSTKKYYFKCPRKIHNSELFKINDLTIERKSRSNGNCRQCESFGQWCIDNNHKDWLDLWDYNLNIEDPFSIGKRSGKYIYFKCKNHNGSHSSERKMISTITSHLYLECNQCNSIGQWIIDNLGEDSLSKIWDYDLNKKSPFEISHGSQKTKIWIKCIEKDYHGSYQISCNDFINGCRCPYCASKKIHYRDSFAQWCIDNVDKDFMKKYWSDKNKLNPFTLAKNNLKTIYINCQNNCNHVYDTTPNKFLQGIRCPYCSHRKVTKDESLGVLFPEVLSIWSNKNEISPYEVTCKSNKYIWFKCKSGKHDDYMQQIYNAQKSHFDCPYCVREMNKSKLQEKVEDYLINKNFDLKFEYDISLKPINIETKYVMPFDIEVVNLKLVIEVHGIQHYQICYFHELQAREHNSTPEDEFKKQQQRDLYKKNYALGHNYYYLEIPYWTENNDEYKDLIDNKIKKIKNNKIKKII